ncbi:uncharacterized protein N0V89_004229 [Didymosphaeria variabile]|uniref:Uncharacterized protein n=1 Tax=Didymosphaeria variabile TaxID=1932322 RepID=A0A9W9CC84_9PLEO|nr:uncharacterized protein N0V89_004229 [Didymosphaeria variabile]KAJ4356199.1 hypothetical protein N0V89_004229 [Didymosphaeria variabile]
MFVPRSLRLKGVKETQKRKIGQPQSSGAAQVSSEDALVQAMQRTSTDSVAPSPEAQAEEHGDKPTVLKSSKPATTAASLEYLAQVVAGIELIFTDYAHQDKDGAKWLQERHRTVDGEEEYVHLTAILDHPNIATLKPQATQSFLRKALQEVFSPSLELSSSGFYVRRLPSTYPAPFVPSNSFSITDDDGLSFWDQRAIYVEPHIRHMCKTPAKVAHWLKEHGGLRAKWLPVQAVRMLYNGCAFVILSGNVMHEDRWKKWRAAGKPDDWRVMTKVENLKRTQEYERLVRESRTEIAKQRRDSREGGNEDRRSVVRYVPGTSTAGDGEQAANRKKRKRERSKTATDMADDEADTGAAPEGNKNRANKRRA